MTDCVNRICEDTGDDPCIEVTLGNRFSVDFFQTGLSDEEYIRRARAIQILEEEG